MNKSMTKILSLVLAVCFCLSMSAFAAEIDTSGGSGNTPVNLTTTNGGLDENGNPTGEAAPTKLSVVVPTSLPMAMSEDGDVVTATNCKIVNNSYGAVRVKSVNISAASDWHLTAFGDKSTLAAEKVDSNKLGFAMSIGGGAQVKTSTDDESQMLITAPIEGCYMTGIGDAAKNFADIVYSAIVTPLSDAVENSTIANVVFVIEWDTVA